MKGLELQVSYTATRDDGTTVGLGDDPAQPIETTVFEGVPLEELAGEVFRFSRKEWGRCVGKAYVGAGHHIGWVFQKRQPYEDDASKSSIIDTWVTLVQRVNGELRAFYIDNPMRLEGC